LYNLIYKHKTENKTLLLKRVFNGEYVGIIDETNEAIKITRHRLKDYKFVKNLKDWGEGFNNKKRPSVARSIFLD
jgi:hypothetical protein